MTLSYTLLILAGGQGSRMGGRDKGLVQVGGMPLVARLLAAADPAPARVVISANRNHETYRRWADTVIGDRRDDYPGPMAGLEAGLTLCDGVVLCLPCDLYAPPSSLIPALLGQHHASRVTVIEDDRGLQPLCLALQPGWRASITDYLDGGGRSVRGWLDTVPHERVRIPARLENLNRLPEPETPLR